jgi:8-oxo-dGTP pyrophosphatase MutT (NUDIX family)
MSRIRSWIRRLGYALCRLYWHVTRPMTVGVRCVLVQEGKVLLVRHTYQRSWYLPGGGVKRGETLEQAVRREAAEEVGAALGKLGLLGVYSNFWEGKSDHVAVFSCEDGTLTGKTDGEIERFAWFSPQALPEGTSPGTRRRLLEYLERGGPYVGRW